MESVHLQNRYFHCYFKNFFFNSTLCRQLIYEKKRHLMCKLNYRRRESLMSTVPNSHISVGYMPKLKADNFEFDMNIALFECSEIHCFLAFHFSSSSLSILFRSFVWYYQAVDPPLLSQNNEIQCFAYTYLP